MDTNIYKEAVKNTLKPQIKSKKEIQSKTVALYPKSAEREMARLVKAYQNIILEEMKKSIPAVMKTYKECCRVDARYDDILDFHGEIRKIFSEMLESANKKLSKFRLREKLIAIANQTKNTSIREWKRSVKKTLGIDIFDDYYSGEFYRDSIINWVNENTSFISSIPTSTLDTMEQVILEGYSNGKSVSTIAKDIQSRFDVTKNKAYALARDQISTLNAQITRMQQTDAGCKKYRWSTSGDSRVRDCHKALDGKVFSWDDPPEMWYRTKEGIKKTGRRCAPGEDYACRCVAIPVFDIEGLDLPLKNTSEMKVITTNPKGD